MRDNEKVPNEGTKSSRVKGYGKILSHALSTVKY